MAYAYAPDSLVNSRNNVYFASNKATRCTSGPEYPVQAAEKGDPFQWPDPGAGLFKPSFTAARRNGFTLGRPGKPSRDYRANGSTRAGSGAVAPSPASTGTGLPPSLPIQRGRGCSLTTSSCYTRVETPARPSSRTSPTGTLLSYPRPGHPDTPLTWRSYSLPENARISWQLLNSSSCLIGSGSSNCYNNYLRDFTGQHRVNFFNWLENLSVGGGTRLRQAMTRAGSFSRRPASTALCLSTWYPDLVGIQLPWQLSHSDDRWSLEQRLGQRRQCRQHES